MRNAAQRLVTVPFETAVAVLLVASGTAGLFHAAAIDPVDALLPHPEAMALYAMGALTGLLMIIGGAGANRGAEIAGLLFLCGVLLDRFILFGYYLGFGASFAVTGIFDAAIIWAALTRLATIRRHKVLVVVPDGRGRR